MFNPTKTCVHCKKNHSLYKNDKYTSPCCNRFIHAYCQLSHNHNQITKNKRPTCAFCNINTTTSTILSLCKQTTLNLNGTFLILEKNTKMIYWNDFLKVLKTEIN